GGPAGGRLLQLLFPRLYGTWGGAHGPGAGGLRGGARRSGALGAGVPRPDAGARQVCAALHAARPPERSRVSGLELRNALPVRHAVLSHHARWETDALPLPAGGGGRPANPRVRGDLAVGAAVPAAAGRRAGR